MEHGTEIRLPHGIHTIHWDGGSLTFKCCVWGGGGLQPASEKGKMTSDKNTPCRYSGSDGASCFEGTCPQREWEVQRGVGDAWMDCCLKLAAPVALSLNLFLP